MQACALPIPASVHPGPCLLPQGCLCPPPMRYPCCFPDAYRRAVDLNPQDFRAWYGLGQAYELLKMPAYAVYYYRSVGPWVEMVRGERSRR